MSRNTPTHVGKTDPDVVVNVQHGKHPHARGEDAAFFVLKSQT